MKKLFSIMVWSAVFSVSVLAQAQSPRIIFSDLQSGPNSGGLNSKGTIVTVYGFGFGASRGTSSVTIGGAPADNYPQWSDTRISFQLGTAAVSGNIVVHVGSAASNGTAFTVRPGKIYFVSPTGNDANAGTAAAPWHSVVKAKNASAAGDIIYLMNGVNESGLEGSNASLTLAKSGSASLPIALVAFPGATATIGSSTGQQYGIRTTSASNYWVLSGLTLRGAFSALNVANSSTWRVIGNDISCPNGSGSGACVDFSGVTNMSLYRNRVHDVGSTTSTSLKLYQGVLFDAGSNGIDFGWNEIGNVRSCRALQFSSDTGKLYNITVDNNLIHDSRCDGINFATVDPALGSVRAYNNVIYRAGTGPAPGGVESNYACINVGAAGSAAVLVQNNTLYDCGRRANGDSGAISASAAVNVVNNIIVATTGEKYLAPNSLTTRFSGSNNLFFGAGASPAFSSASINSDPRFADPTNANFQLLSGSPAIDRGANTGITRDMLQTPRPSGAAYDMGAYEYTAAVTPPPQQGTLSVTPQSLAFGNVVVGASASQNVAVSNASTAPVTISNLSVSGAGFSQNGATLPLTLAAGQSATIAVKFAPTAASSATGSLQITSNATNASIAVALTGTGTAAPPQQGTLTVSSQSLTFGSVVVGSSSSQNITVSNSSTAAVTISNLGVTGAGFSRSAVTLPLTLAVGQSAAIAVKFAPTAAGGVTGSLQITSNATNASIAVALSGTGTAAPQGTLTVNPQSLAFGSVLIGSSANQTVTLSNTSGTAVTVSKVSATGAGFSQSSLTLPLTLASGQTASFTATFAPQTAGSASGSIQITSNATNSSASVALTGTGSTVQHSVDVAWDASTPAASGYNVYRSTQSGGPFTKLNAAPITVLIFTDNTVSSGVTYFYTVTSVAADGSESGDSAVVTAVVPNP
jgi:hypothetical protein